MYERSTTATTLDALPEPLRGAARERIESALLDVPAGAPAYLTRSVRTKRPGLLGRLTGSGDPDAEHHVAVVLGRPTAPPPGSPSPTPSAPRAA